MELMLKANHLHMVINRIKGNPETGNCWKIFSGKFSRKIIFRENLFSKIIFQENLFSNIISGKIFLEIMLIKKYIFFVN